MKPFVPRGAKVLVTGASAGIGRCTAVALEKAGSHIALAARRLDRVQELRATFQFPGEHIPLAMDVRDAGSVATAFASIAGRFNKLDGVVVNAGVGAWFPVHETPEAEMARIIETNLYGAVRCVQHAVPLLERSGGGTIVLVSSVVGRRGTPGMGLYCASKFALHGLADAMRIELEPKRIDVSLICPGLTTTEFHDAATGEKGARPPAGEGESPEAVAAGIVELLQSGKPEVHRYGALSPKRWVGVITQFFPRMVDRKLAAYYNERRASNKG